MKSIVHLFTGSLIFYYKKDKWIQVKICKIELENYSVKLVNLTRTNKTTCDGKLSTILRKNQILNLLADHKIYSKTVIEKIGRLSQLTSTILRRTSFSYNKTQIQYCINKSGEYTTNLSLRIEIKISLSVTSAEVQIW